MTSKTIILGVLIAVLALVICVAFFVTDQQKNSGSEDSTTPSEPEVDYDLEKAKQTQNGVEQKIAELERYLDGTLIDDYTSKYLPGTSYYNELEKVAKEIPSKYSPSGWNSDEYYDAFYTEMRDYIKEHNSDLEIILESIDNFCVEGSTLELLTTSSSMEITSETYFNLMNYVMPSEGIFVPQTWIGGDVISSISGNMTNHSGNNTITLETGLNKTEYYPYVPNIWYFPPNADIVTNSMDAFGMTGGSSKGVVVFYNNQEQMMAFVQYDEDRGREVFGNTTSSIIKLRYSWEFGNYQGQLEFDLLPLIIAMYDYSYAVNQAFYNAHAVCLEEWTN